MQPAYAELHKRGGGMAYDDVLDVTWVLDAGLANAHVGTYLTWWGAIAWADGLVYAGFSDWRLPTVDVNGDSTGSVVDCEESFTTEIECRDNEYGYLYTYNGVTYDTPGDFVNLMSLYYWSSKESPNFPGLAVLCRFTTGFCGTTSKDTNNRHAIAVRDGDVGVPDGDLAPLGAPDGLVNIADLLIATRISMGLLNSTNLELLHGDVYPANAPDGVINIQDLLEITKIVVN